MSQRYELIHSASFTSSLFRYRRLFVPIRSYSLRGTNISSSPKSASLIPYYPIPVPYSHIRSSKNSAIFYSILSKMPSVLFGAAVLFGKSTAGRVAKYPKGKPHLNGLEGGFEPDLNGFLNQKQSAATTPQGKGIRSFVTAGRVEPQLNGLEGGFEPDLNGFSESTIVIAPLVPFVPDSFRLCTAVNLRFKASELQASTANFDDMNRRRIYYV